MFQLNIKYIFLLLLAAVVALGVLSSEVAASEAIYICKPCSREFIPEAQTIIDELGLQDKVIIKGTSCLGHCDKPMVLKFRDRIYDDMDGEKLEAMLKDAFGLS